MNQQVFQHIHDLLQKTTVPDTAVVKEATNQLQALFANPECIPPLAEIAFVSQEFTIRQLAAVELRKRISGGEKSPWILVPEGLRTGIKAKLLEHQLTEPQKIVRHSLSRVIAAVAGVEYPHGQWPELFPFVQGACTSSNAAHRESGVFILFCMLEIVVEGLQNKISELIGLFQNLLQDPQSIEVRLVTVRALGTLAGYIDLDDKPDIKAFQALVPQMLQVAGEALATDNEEGAKNCFDTLSTLLIIETPLLAKHVKELVSFCIQAGSKTDLDEDLRIIVLNCLVMAIKYKKTKIHNLGLGPHIVGALMPLLTERDTDDEDEETPARLAIRALDTLATSLPPQQIFPALHAQVLQYSQSADPNQRRAALMALGVVMEGCSEFIRPHIEQVWPYIDNGLADPDATVRKAACTAIGCITEWLDEECAERHAVLLPALLKLTDDPVTQAAACTALDGLVELLGDSIQNYLTLLMETFVGLTRTAPPKVKAVVIGAIGSVAHASKERFLPYFEPTIKELVPYLTLKGDGEEEELRGIAMDACGTFAESVPTEAFLPYFEDLMKNAYECVGSDSARLRECAFLFFGTMASLFPEKFAPYLPNIIPAFIQSMKLLEIDDPLTLIQAVGEGDSSQNPIEITENVTIDMEDVDLDDPFTKVNSAIAIEKEIAADVIGGIFANTKERFLPYLEETALALKVLVEHYYEGIRKAAIQSLFTYIVTLNELSAPHPWVAGGTNIVPLDQNVAKLIAHVMPEILEAFDVEDDKTVAAAICQSLADATTKVGPALIEHSFETICSICSKVLQGKSLSQVDPDQEDDEIGAEELAELDTYLINACEDLVSALASVLGRDFAPTFKEFLPLIAQYYGAKRTTIDRSSCVGCFGEIITGLKGAVTPYTAQLRELLIQALQDPEPEVKSNAAFSIGVLVENSDVAWTKEDFEAILFRLRPSFTVPEGASKTVLNARDNAAGAVSRLILTNSQIVPLETVLPVLFDALPLDSDPLENRPLFRAIFLLFSQNPNYILHYLDKLIPAFVRVLDPNNPDEIGDENRANLIQLLASVNQHVPGRLQAAGLGAFLA